MVEQVINAKVFTSYSTEITEACIGVLREEGIPFADMGGFGAGSGIIHHYGIYRSVARRIKSRGKSEDNDSDATALSQMLIKLGDKVDSDNHFIINHLLAVAIKSLGRDVLIHQAKKAGNKEAAKKYEQEKKTAKENRNKLFENTDEWTALSIIPVPKIQKIMIEETLKDELGFTRRLSNFK